MAAYVIGDVDVHDPEAYVEYRKLVAPTIEKYGGRFLVRGGPHEVIEGDQVPHRIVVLEFESVAQAKAWHSSEEYAPAIAIRQKAATSNVIIVEGV
jgi:uncharacterized protein (DUF1330 family)